MESWPVVADVAGPALSLSIVFFGMNWKHPQQPGVIQRKAALAWIAIFVAYTLLMSWQEIHAAC